MVSGLNHLSIHPSPLILHCSQVVELVASLLIHLTPSLAGPSGSILCTIFLILCGSSHTSNIPLSSLVLTWPGWDPVFSVVPWEALPLVIPGTEQEQDLFSRILDVFLTNTSFGSDYGCLNPLAHHKGNRNFLCQNSYFKKVLVQFIYSTRIYG